MKRTGRAPRYGRPLEIAVFPANAWQCYAEDDTAAVLCRRLGNMYYLHFEIRQTSFVSPSLLQPNSGRLIISVVVNPVLLTILGFVVGLALSFRSSSAYER